MRRPIDSLFGRLALLVVAVLLASHVAGYLMFRWDKNHSQSRYAVEEAVFLVEAVREHVARAGSTPLPPRVRVVGLSASDLPPAQNDLSESLTRFISDLSERMPPGSQVRVAPGHPPMLWVHEAADSHWIVVPMIPMHPPRSLDRLFVWLTSILTIAVICALFVAWRLQRPLTDLAQGVARFGRGQPVPPLPERGPREVRDLTHGFNQMVREVSRTEKDRAVMLAGIAHDLRTPLARMRLRAEMMEDAKLRDGVVRDVDSMTHIVDQFLVFAHDGVDSSEMVEVDDHCERIARSYRAVAPGTPTVRTDLAAGAGFRLPTATLDRILSNLLDNAHAYGAPPVVVRTARTSDGWLLSVSDHGQGIAPQDLIQASRPFVRLDPARGGNGHSGLGLAIVERLVRRLGGGWEIGNAENGGLRIVMTFPRDTLASVTAQSEAAW
ncbi:ATP-binding protein [Trinickia sp. EG282A]|uniref:ATP-binding protein n=1 Tax=Trinickia sp. EG282A TaxID=3237013 RepID=UPI0034D36A77